MLHVSLPLLPLVNTDIDDNQTFFHSNCFIFSVVSNATFLEERNQCIPYNVNAEDGSRLEILDLESRGIILSV